MSVFCFASLSCGEIALPFGLAVFLGDPKLQASLVIVMLEVLLALFFVLEVVSGNR